MGLLREQRCLVKITVNSVSLKISGIRCPGRHRCTNRVPARCYQKFYLWFSKFVMSTMKNPNSSSSKAALFSHIKYEHLVAGISGGVTSTLILHPLDLIKIRFAGKLCDLISRHYHVRFKFLARLKNLWLTFWWHGKVLGRSSFISEK